MTTKKLSQIAELIQQNNIPKAISQYDNLCMSPDLSVTDKHKIIIDYYKNLPEEARDMIARQRDLLPFLAEPSLDQVVKLLTKIARSPEIDAHERVMTTVCLYNHGYIDICYRCFSELASDTSLIITYRIEAARYLFGTQMEEYLEVAQDCLIDIVSSQEYSSEYRYNVIAGYITKTGIATMLNSQKIRVPYNEEFVYGLQSNFFFNTENGIRERILSGQHMLDMSERNVKKEEKEKIGKMLIEIASDSEKYDERARADAADVMMRMGSEEQRIIARRIIAELGFSYDKNGKLTIIDKAKTIYSNRENVHQMDRCVVVFIDKMVKDTSIKVKPYHEVHNDVAELVRSAKEIDGKKITKAIRDKIYKSLNRISIDTASFGKYKTTNAEIFVNVWARIQKRKSDERKVLEQRLIEELLDMSDTCSSGYAGRLVNVLSEFDVELRITWDEQIKSNIVGRINAKIRDEKDEDIRVSLAMGVMENADEEDRRIYNEYIQHYLEKIKVELYKEFVNGRFVTENEFEEYFTNGSKAVIDIE